MAVRLAKVMTTAVKTGGFSLRPFLTQERGRDAVQRSAVLTIVGLLIKQCLLASHVNLRSEGMKGERKESEGSRAPSRVVTGPVNPISGKHYFYFSPLARVPSSAVRGSSSSFRHLHYVTSLSFAT